ncbi:uncharacterized protein [Zea mays]|nr:uncharacterized protein LOC100275792 isoform X1 [Zea mays]|eukprot:XP_008676931.1 uncharacterized protein LOC100275792 isoform X1 [Zea mays]
MTIWEITCVFKGVGNIKSNCALMEASIPSFESMPILCGMKEMETSQTANLGIHQELGPEISQNPMGNHVNPEKETNEIPGSEVNQELVEICQGAVVETDTIQENQAVPEAGLEVNEETVETCQETAAESDVNLEKQTSDPGVIYRCRKCRRMLATQEFVVTHEVGAGGKSFRAGKRSNVHEDDEKPECPCIFVEPMKWMQTVEEGYVAKKLFCMGCKARLGQFNWAGMQCSCGAWVIPAFQLTKSKIDQCSM